MEEREKNAYKSFILKKDGLDAWANDCLNYDEIKFGYIYPGERNKGDKTFLWKHVGIFFSIGKGMGYIQDKTSYFLCLSPWNCAARILLMGL